MYQTIFLLSPAGQGDTKVVSLPKYYNRTQRDPNPEHIEKLRALFRLYPILNKTILNYAMGIGGPEWDSALSTLLRDGTLRTIRPTPGSQFSDRFYLAEAEDTVRPFMDDLDVDHYLRFVPDTDPLYRMKRHIVHRLTLYPILIRSFLAAAVGVSGGYIQQALEALETDVVTDEQGERLTVVSYNNPTRPSHRGERLYLTELGELLGTFLLEE